MLSEDNKNLSENFPTFKNVQILIFIVKHVDAHSNEYRQALH